MAPIKGFPFLYLIFMLTLTEVFTAPRNIVEMKVNKESEDEKQIFPGKKVGHGESMKTPDEILSEQELKPADHLDAVRMEQDGMLNKDFKKEIFLGEHEEIDDDPSDIAESKVKDIFDKVDTDDNGKMCSEELEFWIQQKTQEHFDEAKQENDHIFEHMDPDGDGLVKWKEYYVHFLLAKGFPIEQATKHVVDYDEIQLDYDVQESLVRYKFRWTDADIDPTDNNLSKREFMAFRHPEQSEQALLKMVRTILENLDQNDDGKLSLDEFKALSLGELEDEEARGMDKNWQEEREKEFTKNIDSNSDGVATEVELLKYIDPRNESQVKTDVVDMLDTIDDDQDKCISWDEILNHREYFLQTKVISVKRILHDEF